MVLCFEVRGPLFHLLYPAKPQQEELFYESAPAQVFLLL